ncbi:MAG: acetate kinase, partial [Thermomonas sp.]
LSGYAPMAPLHQPAALRLVEASRVRWPTARHVAVFDTSWHQTLADWSRRLPIPQRFHDAGIKRYGFHGLAFQSAMRKLDELDHATDRQRIVLVHLGSGCSLCAVDHGQSVDTTMGMTPLDGLPMATRSGALDPGAVLFLGQQLELSHAAIEVMLWHESGLLGVSGISGDMRELLDATDASSNLAIEQFVIRVAQGIASMAVGIGGIDAIVFSGGIGSHAPVIRQRIVEHLSWIGLRVHRETNVGGATRIDAEDSSAKIWRIEVDEEYELAVAAVTQP